MNIKRFTRSLLLLAAVVLIASAASFGQVVFSVSFGPPALPVYEQPLVPGPGYMWTPGYWAYGPDGYFWVPGTWVLAPQPGVLWTPGYWGWGEGAYLWHEGYWGPHIGFYGGVPYGYGYTGAGFEGGYWNHGDYYYNRNVTNVNTTSVTNVYNKTVVNNTTVNNVSYNGGTGGITARPTAAQEAVARERHVAPTAAQTQHVQTASTNRQLLASENHGRPAIAATAKPGDFKGRGVVPAKTAGAPYKAPEKRQAEARPVPRPPAAAANHAAAGRTNTAVPRTAPTPVSQPHLEPAAPHPAIAPHPAAAPPRPVSVPHPAAAPPRPASVPHPAAAPPRPVSVPHPAAAPPRPVSAPHPAAPPAKAPPPEKHP